MTDRHDKFEELLSERFREFRQEPPEGLFERIAQSVEAAEAAPQRKVVVPLWRRPVVRLAGAAIVAASLLVALFIPSLHAPVEQVAIEQLAEMCAEEVAQPVEAEGQEQLAEAAKPTSVSISCPVAKVAQTIAPALQSTSVEEQAEKATVKNHSTEKEEPEAEVVTKAKKSNKQCRRQRRRVAEAEEYWRNQIAQEEYYSQSSHNPVEVRLYAANVGFNEGNIEKNNVASSPMLIRENSATSNPSSSLQTEGASLRANSSALPASSLQHFMPVTVGARVSYSLNGWLAVESGLTYTNLYSRSKNWGAVNEYNCQQNQHLLGIPLALSANFVDIGPVSLYAKAGTSIDLNISTSHNVYIDGVLIDSHPMQRHGFYYSIDVSAGASYALWRGLGLFAEFGVTYWQATKPQPISYRTETPLGMSIQVGLKYTFN